MNQVNTKYDQFFEFSDLSGMAMLDEVERYEIEFNFIYQKTLAFLEKMVDTGTYENIQKEMIENAGDFEGRAYTSMSDVKNGVWAGYHPLPLLFSRLCWYGEKGMLHYNDVSDVSGTIHSKGLNGEINLAKEFHDAIPADWLESDELLGKGEFGKTICAAEGRYLLDSAEALGLEHIIALSGMSLRSVRNSLSKSDTSGLRVDDNGNISNAEAKRWLTDRKNFKSTRMMDDDETPLSAESEESAGDVEYIFVPITDDGAAFLPNLRRQNGYQVGKKGNEVYYESFYEALHALQAMPTPSFRRPNEVGNWGIKVGRSWMRIAKSEIDNELD